jgi:hypothetical protein
MRRQLAKLARELDSERMRTQPYVSLDPAGRVTAGGRTSLGLAHSLVRPAQRRELDTDHRPCAPVPVLANA